MEVNEADTPSHEPFGFNECEDRTVCHLIDMG